MAFTLTGSVGRMGGLNRTEDVRKVQNALNKVPQTQGGPAKRLEPDGTCGNKTIEAIQIFQIKHFGWSGADGRVDVDGVTHRKLNEFDGPIYVPGGGTETGTLTTDEFKMRLDTGPGDVKFSLEEWRFLVTDEANGISAVYRLHKLPDIKGTTTRPWGSPLTISVDEPTTVEAFEGAAFGYTTVMHYDPKKGLGKGVIDTMVLRREGQSTQTFLTPPWSISDCWIDASKDPTVARTYKKEVLGQLRLVKTAQTEVAPGAQPATSILERQKFAASLLSKAR
jgi:hypothetical protein